MKFLPVFFTVVVAGLLFWSLSSLVATATDCDGAIVVAIDLRTNPYICIEGK